MNDIIVGVDSSPTARAAAQQAVEMAKNYSRTLHIVMAVSANEIHEIRGAGSERFHIDLVTAAEQSLLALASDLGVTTPFTTAVVLSDPAEALCEQARLLDASTIVVGNKRVQGAARILGSIAGKVARSAPCDVFIVHTC